MTKVKPFIKWAGGKGQLIGQLEELLPTDFSNWEDVTYMEPFVGGGAMLFHMLQTYPNITRAVINDINPNLTNCYRVVRDRPTDLLCSLQEVQEAYYACTTQEARREMYTKQRARFNASPLDEIENATLFIFLNRTCFNGLYRVNSKGQFNVPCGSYVRPLLCDRETIYADSELLQSVEIMTGDFEATIAQASIRTFCYLDPPYRPLSNTSSFNDYAKETFDDNEQRRLKHFCDMLDGRGIAFMMSNSDCLAKDGTDRFFDDLYADYSIERVWASRNINANPLKRGKLTEIVVTNYRRHAIAQPLFLAI